MTTRYIKVKAECVLPVPVDVRDDLDAVAEAGLSALRSLIADNLTTHVPGTVASSWQSMPQSWQPRRSNVVLAEQIAPGVSHAIVRDDAGEERVMFVEEPTMTHPWANGEMIFPPDHPFYQMERRYFLAYRQSADAELMTQFGRDVKALEAGDDTDD